MKLVAMTYGTKGDTRPMAALCRALMDAGHELILLADAGTLDDARDLGVPHAALEGIFRSALQPSADTSSGVAGTNNLNATAQALARLANENADAWIRQVLEAAAGADGLIVAGLAAFIGFSAAEKLGVPVIGAGMIPLTPTSAFPIAILGSSIDATIAQPFQLSPCRRSPMARLPYGHERSASEGGAASRAQDLVWSSHALRNLADPVAEASGLAEQRVDVWTIGCARCVRGTPPITARLRFCW